MSICLVGLGNAFAQESVVDSELRRDQETDKKTSQQTAGRGMRASPDLATDNLDHVAATAEEILEFLKRDAGLMVEFKRLLARDAAAAGQLLDETDLTDAAVIERLNEDLRARVPALSRLAAVHRHEAPGT